MKYQDTVANIRANLTNLSTDSVVYRWWFKDSSTIVTPLKNNPNIDSSKLITKAIGNTTYYALYVGIGVSCQERFKWHIQQKHTPSSVKSGILSTLRQTLSALLNKDMTVSEYDVNTFIDQNCILEWDLYSDKSKQQLEEIENSIINEPSGYYPLNIQKNKNVSVVFQKNLTTMRKNHKK
ncbi:MAG TPA: hypothetical protein P5564_00715 [Paludibacteraceae bacterium]|nr:hypothetical protein [Paludibacteraceae bacterium]